MKFRIWDDTYLAALRVPAYNSMRHQLKNLFADRNFHVPNLAIVPLVEVFSESLDQMLAR
jgi:hypothetical protein